MFPASRAYSSSTSCSSGVSSGGARNAFGAGAEGLCCSMAAASRASSSSAELLLPSWRARAVVGGDPGGVSRKR